MPARDEILNRIRVILSRPDLPFPAGRGAAAHGSDTDDRDAATGDALALAQRFGAELEQLHGTL